MASLASLGYLLGLDDCKIYLRLQTKMAWFLRALRGIPWSWTVGPASQTLRPLIKTDTDLIYGALADIEEQNIS